MTILVLLQKLHIAIILPVYLTLARLTTLPRRRVRPLTVGTGSYPSTQSKPTYPSNSPSDVRRMSSSPAVHQGRLTYLSVRVTQAPTNQVRHQNGPVASRRARPATQWHQGGDDQMNPTITTGNSALYGSEKDQVPSPQA